MTLRSAANADLSVIWAILQEAIDQRRRDGSSQWQDGYPNEHSIRDDISRESAYVLVEEGKIIAYAAVVFGAESAYNEIRGKWLTDGEYAVVHRVARSAASAASKGIGTRFIELIEGLCLRKGIPSIRLDTNFDNFAMLRILEKLNYRYCGEVMVRGAARRAYEKILMGSTGNFVRSRAKVRRP